MSSIPSPFPSPFTLMVDWLAFTVPHAFPFEVMEVLGGDWTQSKAGFRGYPESWMMSDGFRGMGKLGSGAPGREREVHGDLSGGIVSAWEIAHLRKVLGWVQQMNGHVTRLDCALDDRTQFVSVQQVQEAFEAGQAVTRASKLDRRECRIVETGASEGVTLYFGSPTSLTKLRVYDKRLELKRKHRDDWQDYGTRWELEFRKDRGNACAKQLLAAPDESWQEIVVGLLRSYIDFRETSREASSVARSRAPLLAWWEELTSGFQKARLVVGKRERSLEEIQEWFKRNLAPMFAVLYVTPGLGDEWIKDMINSGADRWRPRHFQLLKRKKSTDS